MLYKASYLLIRILEDMRTKVLENALKLQLNQILCIGVILSKAKLFSDISYDISFRIDYKFSDSNKQLLHKRYNVLVLI